MSDILQYTSLDEIESKISHCNDYFYRKQREVKSTKRDLEFRSNCLKKLYYAIKENEEALVLAMHNDFHRSRQESLALELIPLYNDVLDMISRLPQWIKPKKVKDYSPVYAFGTTKIEKIPRGTALVISPSNFPVYLALGPVAAAISAGNTVVLKPSENTPSTAKIIEKILLDAELPQGLIEIVQGGVTETTKLIKSPKFDIFFYTGSTKVGSIVAQEAAKHLIPCVLELGGKSPFFITENSQSSKFKMDVLIKRLFFGGFGSAGQICVAPDYVLIHESKYNEFVVASKKVLDKFYSGHIAEYTAMISMAAYDKMNTRLKSTRADLYQPSSLKASDPATSDKVSARVIVPTLAFDCDWDDPLMQEENFGPVLPIVKYNDLDDLLDKVIRYHDTPLVQYIFSDSKPEIDHILRRVRSGGCVINDTIVHVAMQNAPFGGIGKSGYGNYHGIYGFNAFTHERTIFKQAFWMDFLLSMRYPPYSEQKSKLIQMTTEQKPWFDKDGRTFIFKNIKFLIAIFVAILSITYYFIV
ncbi:hypothetical protein KAFR_0A00560 [Kazachstania africana CBS 2517]|uniref:Aldehyde dehydrogenase n=1 Tax=Kazachstania africana (strain ATCC 22294 / BCRC 22015 / CBS 2517 / CECT 1963 / NBRC 1671 / NRRL Y-8276) TaxID=1071382 RepID=H2AM94_KAZAF|nr:hypothetical protein KAFR_0A00560 [Kazachstania africana CBS 2517]CCF55494.1 hypothetical protein KAFR_0A00560 [Kazachstania africana CBS 2517]